MPNKMKFELDSIVNLACCKAEISYGGVLVIGLGELIEEKNRALKGIYRGQWEIRSYSATWRILKGNDILVGEYDDEPLIKSSLKSLVGTKLISFELLARMSDVKIVFENNISLEILTISAQDESWSLNGPSCNIEARSNVGLVKIDSDVTNSLDTNEMELSIHAGETAKRWQPIVPAQTKENNCSSCWYYRELRGGFHFWDYGLCSNANSIYDGKVVNVESSCNQFDTDLKAPNPSIKRDA